MEKFGSGLTSPALVKVQNKSFNPIHIRAAKFECYSATAAFCPAFNSTNVGIRVCFDGCVD